MSLLWLMSLPRAVRAWSSLALALPALPLPTCSSRACRLGASVAPEEQPGALTQFRSALDVVVIEGRSRNGGRVHSIPLGTCAQSRDCELSKKGPEDGSVVDLGASYIHGCNGDNAVLDIARALGVDLRREYGGYQAGWLRDARWYVGEGRGALTPGLVQPAWWVCTQLAEVMRDRADAIVAGRAEDLSVDTFVTDHLPPELLVRKTKLLAASKLVFTQLVNTMWGYVGPIELFSLRQMAREFFFTDDGAPRAEDPSRSVLGGARAADGDGQSPLPDEDALDDDALVVDGYSFLVRHLERGVNVLHNTVVRSVVRHASGAHVFCT